MGAMAAPAAFAQRTDVSPNRASQNRADASTPLPAKIYANEGVAQVIFFEVDEVCETSYKDRGGKYQAQ